jgi:hypothetical protein
MKKIFQGLGQPHGLRLLDSVGRKPDEADTVERSYIGTKTAIALEWSFLALHYPILPKKTGQQGICKTK